MKLKYAIPALAISAITLGACQQQEDTQKSDIELREEQDKAEAKQAIDEINKSFPMLALEITEIRALINKAQIEKLTNDKKGFQETAILLTSKLKEASRLQNEIKSNIEKLKELKSDLYFDEQIQGVEETISNIEELNLSQELFPEIFSSE